MRNSSHHHIGFWNSIALVTVFSLAMIIFPTNNAVAQSTDRVSLHSDGLTQGDDTSLRPSISADGRFVAFESRATNLVDNDTNGYYDVFVHDRTNNQTTRISLGFGGAEPNGSSQFPSISADGRYVAFHSTANNLVDGVNNNQRQVYVYDRDTGQTVRVSESSDGTPGDVPSLDPTISADGQVIAFVSGASNLVIGDAGGFYDIFVRDLAANTISRISVHTDGTPGNGENFSCDISADGKIVAFRSHATTLVDGDTNVQEDIFVHDRDTHVTTRINMGLLGAQGNEGSDTPCISADGRFVGYRSYATNLVTGDTNGNADIFVYDRQLGTTTRVSVNSDGEEGDFDSFSPSLSADGSYVAFYSDARNLVADDTNLKTDVFHHDLTSGETIRASTHTDGATEGDGDSNLLSISGNGRFVAFSSTSTNLVADDTNGRTDVFVRDVTGDPPIVNPNPDPNPNPNPTPAPAAASGSSGGCFINIGD